MKAAAAEPVSVHKKEINSCILIKTNKLWHDFGDTVAVNISVSLTIVGTGQSLQVEFHCVSSAEDRGAPVMVTPWTDDH